MMRCRVCGHMNDHDKGRCDNCGFDLEMQNEPLKVQRAALQKPLDGSNSVAVDPVELLSPHKSRAGLIGFFAFLIGAAGAVFILSNFERREYTPEVETEEIAVEEEVPTDSLPIVLGTDIVYVFDPEGTSAVPRTNIDLALIPEGTKVSFLGRGSMSIQPVVNYITQKISSRDFMALRPDSLYAWRDSTETEYSAIPILPVSFDTTEVQPVEVKILFTDQWLRCMIEEFNKDIVEPSGGYRYNRGVFATVFRQAVRTIDRKNTEDRPVNVTLIFPSESTLAEAMEIAESVEVVTDSLDYNGFNIRWVSITD